LRTGDVGYFDDSGNLFVIDRLDSMLIVGGENVYPAEVEKFCTQLPGAAQLVLVGVDDAVWGKRLILAYRAESAAVIDTSAWHKILVENLSPFKVPQGYVSVNDLGLAEFPRRENGKLDRPAIAALIKNRFSEKPRTQ
jgi:long-chain acyl-CoA synthetase